MSRTLTTSIIIDRFKIKHGDFYGYNKVIYKSMKDKVLIYCSINDEKYGIHGYFLQSPDNHLRGRNCPKCTGHYKINQIEFIETSNLMHNNKYIYELVNFINTYNNVIIICPEVGHGSFSQRPSAHMNGAGCKKCGIIVTANKQRKTKKQFISEVFEIFGDNIDCSESIYDGRRTELQVRCAIHNLYFQKIPTVLLEGSGCPECSGKYWKLTTELFIKKAVELHKNEYDYSKVNYVKSCENVIIICKKHNIEFLQTPNSHLTGSGCPCCAIEKTSNSKRMNTLEFINRSLIIHNNLYTYPLTEYTESKNKVIICCLFHGNFTQTPSNHLRGQGCPICRLEQMSSRNLSNTDEFITKSKQLFGENVYDYSLTLYVNCKTKVKLICIKHNCTFEQTPKGHFRKNRGCKKCSKFGYSQKAIKYLQFISTLNQINIRHAENGGEYRILTTIYKADGYCEETNTIYEFHGTIYHGDRRVCPPSNFNYFGKNYGELYQKTLEREQQIRDLGYNLVVMWELDWNKINKSIRTLQRKFRSLH
jgi:hypothetical protein